MQRVKGLTDLGVLLDKRLELTQPLLQATAELAQNVSHVALLLAGVLPPQRNDSRYTHRVLAPRRSTRQRAQGGFSVRLSELADAARAEAVVCRKADGAGFEWPPHKSAGQQPYELQPGTARRGPEGLWQRFDAAVAELNRAGAGTNLLEVARAHELLADVAGELAAEIERQDLARGVLSALRTSLR